LIQLIVARGPEALNTLPAGLAGNRGAMAETIENNLRRVIIDEQPLNPKYYDKMSDLLDALIQERKAQALEYERYLEQIVALAQQVQNPASGLTYPQALDTGAKRALYDNLGGDEPAALALDAAIRQTKKDDWRGNRIKEREVRYAIRHQLQDETLTDQIFELVKHQSEY
jgi:type I restriction enzyme R subunit